MPHSPKSFTTDEKARIQYLVDMVEAGKVVGVLAEATGLPLKIGTRCVVLSEFMEETKQLRPMAIILSDEMIRKLKPVEMEGVEE